MAQAAALDWRRPWFHPWRELAQSVASAPSADTCLAEALDARRLAGPRFVPARHLPAGVAYEQYIFEADCCPTRDNLHDFFNGLVWLQMPLAKGRLNRVQAAQIAAHGVGAQRGPVRDAVTLFDENGAVLCAPQPLWDALVARDWPTLFVQLRPLWARASLLIFGHALLEKLAAPRKNLTAHVLAQPAPPASTAELDGWLAAQLTLERLAAKPFLPLPIMGIPGWCADNEGFSFYDDPLVFRPAGRPEPKSTT